MINVSAWVQVFDTQIKTARKFDCARARLVTQRATTLIKLTRFCVSAIQPTSRSKRLGKTDAKMLEAVGKRTNCDTVTDCYMQL